MQDSPWVEQAVVQGKGIIMAWQQILELIWVLQVFWFMQKEKESYLKEPSVVAFDRGMQTKVKAIGEEARLMLGRTPGNIMAIRPLRQGVISDYTMTEKMLKHFVQKAMGRKDVSASQGSASVCQAA